VDTVLPLPWIAGVSQDGEAVDVDAALVARARRGERGAFDELVRRHQRGLWRLVRRYVKNDADAADVMQQAFVRAFKALERFRGDASVRSWIRVARAGSELWPRGTVAARMCQVCHGERDCGGARSRAPFGATAPAS
jgi:hypothetical protein